MCPENLPQADRRRRRYRHIHPQPTYVPFQRCTSQSYHPTRPSDSAVRAPEEATTAQRWPARIGFSNAFHAWRNPTPRCDGHIKTLDLFCGSTQESSSETLRAKTKTPETL